ncbi:maleylacetate reductase [Paraburkholderia haematera]|jgi:Alcohol dehydrogenase, class IV|uniref:Maleylacetate reductase n=1 Tax=Paraburkholderia haematera TaxID=2793077 RepID=A0ABN7MMA7_9BURK|nr:maleylacetate reductase [Paraburkholderia haematera]CAE6809423.1 Maleylacetate reductase [Paraburkholderia haematera]
MADSTKSADFALDLRGHRIVWSRAIVDVLADEISAAGIQRFLLISSDELARHFDAVGGNDAKRLSGGRFTDVVPHVPEASVVGAVEAARNCDADGLLVFGGGSSLDTAKAVSDRLGLPIIAIPTNFSGSEVTWNFGLTANGVKHTVRNPAVLPKTIIYDHSLLGSLPLDVAVCSGINAVAHAIEALYAPQANPLTQSLAETGIRKMVAGLQELAASKGQSDQAAVLCLTGSWLCGEVLSQVGMGLHHRICHVLGGTFGLPHAQTHTVLLPYSVDWNFDHAAALAQLSGLFPGRSLARGLAELSIRLGAPPTLKSLGLTTAQIPAVARLVLETPVANPRPVAVGDVHAILAQAYAGDLAAK